MSFVGISNRDPRFQGAGRTGKVRVSPASIARVFGHGDNADDYEVVWCFEEVATGAVVSLYEWKLTSSYVPDSGPPSPELVASGVGYEPLMTPEQLRSCEEPLQLHLGGGNVAASKRFVAWLQARLVGEPEP